MQNNCLYLESKHTEQINFRGDNRIIISFCVSIFISLLKYWFIIFFFLFLTSSYSFFYSWHKVHGKISWTSSTGISTQTARFILYSWATLLQCWILGNIIFYSWICSFTAVCTSVVLNLVLSNVVCTWTSCFGINHVLPRSP